MRLFVGYESTQQDAYDVATLSAMERSSIPLTITPLGLEVEPAKALYTRPTERVAGRYVDVISQAAMSTGHAIARFLVPYLCDYQGWAVFTDGDVLFRADLADLLVLADPDCAVQVVQHQQQIHSWAKGRNQYQVSYPRKNWSSVMFWNCGHPSNRLLTVEMVNTLRGRDLHAFYWLGDAEIGALPARWNYLVGDTTGVDDPAIVHFTEGLPDMPGYEATPYADEWRAVRSSVLASI